MAQANAINAGSTGIQKFDGVATFSGITVTNHNLLVGAASNGITSVAPSATSGVAVVSTGAAADPAFGTVVVAGGGTGQVTLTNHGVLIGQSTSAIAATAAGSAGQVLQSGGASADPTYSTATFPSTATGTGKVLIADGTNWVASTPTFPNASATSGKFIRSDGTNWIASTPTLPTSAGTSGKVLQSDGTNYVESTPTYPSASGSTGTILRSDGTNNVYTTATYPATTTANQLLYSSANNTVGGLTSAANSIVLTDGSSVPSLATSLSNDFTFTSATAGATRTLTVSNTNNSNAASQALVQTTTGGASAGDPFHTFTITGATSFSLGLDNSASDAFVIAASTALGTTNVMSVATTGEINFPLQSAFLAYNSAADTDVTGDNTTYTILCDTEVFDQNSDYNSGTGTFTAPVTGRYTLGSYVELLQLGAGHTSGITRIVTSNRTYRCTGFVNPANLRDSNNVAALGGSLLADMDAADTTTFDITVTNSTKTVDVNGSGTVGVTYQYGLLEV